MPKKKKPKGVKKTSHKKKKRLDIIEKRLKRVDKELALIEKELRIPLESRVLAQEFRGRELVEMNVEDTRNLRKFYRNFVFKCMKCLGRFEHNLEFKTIKRKITCPACGKSHGICITPSSRYQHMDVPKSLRVVKKKKK